MAFEYGWRIVSAKPAILDSRKLWGLCPEIGSEVVRGSFQVLEGSGGVRRCWGYLLGLFLV